MNLLRAASTVSLLTLASRITGLARDTLIAAAFGASAWADAFNVAFRIPNLLRRLFAEGAFSQAFVPLLGETRGREGDDATRDLVNAVATMLFWTLLVTVSIGIVASPIVVWLMASALKEFDGAVVMTRIMFPYIGFMSLVALAAGVLNTWKRFAVPAATPVLLNLSMILAAWLLVPQFRRWGIEPAYALAVGVMVGGVLQLAIQVPALARVGCLPRIGLTPHRVAAAWRHPGVHRVMQLMLPAVLGVSVAQLSMIINTQIASHVSVGAVSWLFYADRLMEFPTGMLGVALSVVLIPRLSTAHGRGDAAGYSDMLDWGLRLVLLLTLPCAAALLVFGTPLIAVLFHRGQFSPADVQMTVLALRGYGVGLIGIVAVKVLAPGFYASLNVRTPVKIAVGVLVLTQALNWLLVPHLGHAALALSISLGATVNALLLFFGLRRRGSYVPSPGWAAFAARVVLATAVMSGALWYVASAFDWVALGRHEWQRVGWLAACMAAAVLLYFATLLATGLKFRQFMRRG